jgi:rare lipoprotein A
MRLPDSRLLGRLLPLTLAGALAACGGSHASGHLASAPAVPANGPAADYPVVVGEPYNVAGTPYAPEDKLNYDAVGYAAIDAQGGNAISGEHHTLPLPSYVEVTSLETGKTILVRLERRGPMDGTQLIGLSPAAASQLGASAGTPVRVRRVNPPEEERALLRSGQRAPERIDTPMGLVNVLRRKLPGGAGPVSVASTDLTVHPGPSATPVPASAASMAPVPPVAPATPTAAPAAVAAKSPPPLPPLEQVAPATGATQTIATIGKPGQQDFPWLASAQPAQPTQPKQALPKPAAPTKARPPKPAPAAVAARDDGYVVQAGAFSTRQRAQGVAKAIGGSVSNSGSLYRVRTGPFDSRQEAEASLAKVRGAGYSDARIYSSS